MIFNIDKETMPREKIREIQLNRLQDLCRRVYANVPFYRRSFDEKGIKPADVQSLDDLKFLPFTLKQDMRNNYLTAVRRPDGNDPAHPCLQRNHRQGHRGRVHQARY